MRLPRKPKKRIADEDSDCLHDDAFSGEDSMSSDATADSCATFNLSTICGIQLPEPTLPGILDMKTMEMLAQAQEVSLQTLSKTLQLDISRKKKVVIIGTGGRIGSALTLNLAPIVGEMFLIEPDHVEYTDLAYMPVYRTEDVGKPKVFALQNMLFENFPHIAVEADCSTAEDCINLPDYVHEADLIILAADMEPALRRICKLATLKKPVFWCNMSSNNLSAQFMVSTPPGPCLACIIGLRPGRTLITGSGRDLVPMRHRAAALIAVNIITELLLGKTPHPPGHPLLVLPFEQLSTASRMESLWLPPDPDPSCPYCNGLLRVVKNTE